MVPAKAPSATHRRRVLLIPPRFVGDALLHVGVARLLKQEGLAEWVGLQTPKALHPFFEGVPELDALVPTDKRGLAAVKELHSLQLSHVLLARLSMREGVQAQLAGGLTGVPRVVGLGLQRYGKGLFFPTRVGLHQAVPYSMHQPQQHHMRSLLTLVETAFGLSLPPHYLEPTAWHALCALAPTTCPSAFDDEGLRTTLQALGGACPSQQPTWVLHWASASANKMPSPQALVPLLRHLQGLGLQLVASGLATDAPLYHALNDHLHTPMVVLAGHGSLPMLASLLRQAQGLVGLDSAPLHLAAAVGTPKVLGVYGAVSSLQWGPCVGPATHFVPLSLSLPCKPCVTKTCHHLGCRTLLQPQHYLQAFHTLHNST